jgi:hypothetical protein
MEVPMTESVSKAVKAVCQMPRDFQEIRDVSMVTLLKKSGYLGNAESITEQLLTEYFEQHPDLIDAWVRNSEDTRSSPNWYLRKPTGPNEQWVVGFFPDGTTHRFPQRAQACAFYVKRYLVNLGTHD